jgi:ribonucleoside-diphosphate reductase alpha subunit
MTLTMRLRPVVVTDGQNPPSEFNRERLRISLRESTRDMSSEYIDIDYIVGKVELGLPDSITKEELLQLTAEICASMTTTHYQYSQLGARLLSRNLQNKLSNLFSENFLKIYNFNNESMQNNSESILSEDVKNTVLKHKERINAAIVHTRDSDIDYFGFRTLEKSYLIKINGSLHETPQYLFMRVALGIHFNDIDSAIESYDLMSKKYFIHASPTLFSSGLKTPSLSSCFLLAMKDDSIDGIYKTLHDTAMISKSSGGIGLHVSNIRARGSPIHGSGGTSSVLVPMLRNFNTTAQYVDQGGNKRPGAFCIYLEPWHADVFEFLDLRKNHGKEEMRARDLFMALWIPDLFMKKVETNEEWCLFSEDSCPGLSDCYGDDFVLLYTKYEKERMYIRKVSARKLWHAIIVAQTETGNPFLLYKDRCNALSNQKNLGTIKSSNLCCEIIEYSSKDETAVCNLASLALPTFVNNRKFDFQKLHDISKVAIKNLDRVIDINHYPLENCKVSNFKNRPTGLGVQGLADVFFKMKIPFQSEKAKKLNIQIFETIYHAALEQSCALSKLNGPYETYEGSPISKGILQYDMWGVEPSTMWNWSDLKESIAKYGVRNSLLVALMPTASTSQIFGFNECFEPITSNIYIRRVLSGEHQVVNKYLVNDLCNLGLWNVEMKNSIIADHGSIQQIDAIPADVKALYKTVWEISQKTVIDMAADRGAFVDQSQSMNLFMEDVSFSKLTSMHFYAWKKGLKTGMYYLRTKAAASAIQFSLDPTKLKTRFSVKRRRRSDAKKENRAYSSRFKMVKMASDGDDSNLSEDEQEEEEGINEERNYNIFSKTVISCNLSGPENCESCSA